MKKIRFCLLALFLMMVVSVCVYADEYEYLLDQAGVLTTEEADLLEQRFAQTSAQLSFHIRAVTEESMSGWNAESTADSYYNALNDCGDGYLPGILLYISYSPRQYYITASNNVFNDDMTYTLEQSFLSYLREDDAYNALVTYCDTVQSLVYAYHGESPSFPVDPYESAETPKGNYVPEFDPMPNYVSDDWGENVYADEEVKPLPAWAAFLLPFIDPGFFVLIIVVPLATALFLTHLKVKQMNNAQKKTGAAAFMNAESLKLTKCQEIFLYSNIVSTPKPQNDASHHHTHGGFSGSSHGGFSGGAGASGRVGRGGSF